MTRNLPTRPQYRGYPSWGGRREVLWPGFPLVPRWWICRMVTLQQPFMQFLHRSFAVGFPQPSPSSIAPLNPSRFRIAPINAPSSPVAGLFTPLAGFDGPGVGAPAIPPDVDATASSSGLDGPWWLCGTGRGSFRVSWGLCHCCSPFVIGAHIGD